MPINTLFQLYSMVLAGDSRLEMAGTLLMIPDLFHYFLSGEMAAEYPQATTTQVVRPAGDWAHDILQRQRISCRILPPIIPPATVLSEVSREVLDACGLQVSFPVIAVASHDTASAVASISGLDEKSAFISSGTWSLMGVKLDAPVTSEKAQSLGFTNEGGCNGSLMLMRNPTGPWVIQECLSQWQRRGRDYNWDELASAAAQSRPWHSLINPNASEFLVPGDMPRAILEYCGARGELAPDSVGRFARCCFESLSLAYWSTLQAIRDPTGRDIQTLRVVGGGCRNAFLCQMTANACNCVISGPAEASALGNVMLQAVAIGELPDLAAGRASVGKSMDRVVYHPRTSEGWCDAQMRYRRLETAEVLANEGVAD